MRGITVHVASFGSGSPQERIARHFAADARRPRVANLRFAVDVVADRHSVFEAFAERYRTVKSSVRVARGRSATVASGIVGLVWSGEDANGRGKAFAGRRTIPRVVVAEAVRFVAGSCAAHALFLASQAVGGAAVSVAALGEGSVAVPVGAET